MLFISTPSDENTIDKWLFCLLIILMACLTIGQVKRSITAIIVGAIREPHLLYAKKFYMGRQKMVKKKGGKIPNRQNKKYTRTAHPGGKSAVSPSRPGSGKVPIKRGNR
jgi:hypothetical protein